MSDAEAQPGRSGWGVWALLGGFVLFRCAAPYAPALPAGLNELVSAGLFVWLAAGVLYGLSGAAPLQRHRLWVMVAAFAAWAALLYGSPTGSVIARTAQDLCLLVFAVYIALVVVPLVREPGLLLPIVGAAAIFDTLYVMMGPTATVLTKAPDFVYKVTAAAPMLGGAGAAAEGMKALMVGPGDLMLMAFLFAACRRFELRTAATFVATGAVVWAALLVVAAFGLPLPGWLFLAIAFLIANHGQISLTREERRMMLGALVVGLALIAAAAAYVLTR